MAASPSLDLVGATETTIGVEFKPLPGVTDYELQWKEYPAKWNSTDMHTSAVKATGKKKVQTECNNLQPGSTYCVRLAASGMDPGPELIIDTEQVGCTPKSSGRCIIL
jgi:hypothetical protein